MLIAVMAIVGLSANAQANYEKGKILTSDGNRGTYIELSNGAIREFKTVKNMPELQVGTIITITTSGGGPRPHQREVGAGPGCWYWAVTTCPPVSSTSSTPASEAGDIGCTTTLHSNCPPKAW